MATAATSPSCPGVRGAATGAVDRSFDNGDTGMADCVQDLALAVPDDGGVVLSAGGFRNSACRFDSRG